MENIQRVGPHRPLSPSEIRLVKVFPGDFNDRPRCELEHVSLIFDNSSRDWAYTALSYTWGNPNRTSSIQLDGLEYLVTDNLYFFLQHMQTLLLKVSQSLPPNLRHSGPGESLLRHIIMKNLLSGGVLSRDFLSASKETVDVLVQQLIDIQLANESEEQRQEIEEFFRSDSYTDPKQSFVHFWIDALCINQQDLAEKSLQVLRMRDIYSQAPHKLIWLEDCSKLFPDADTAIDLLNDLDDLVPPRSSQSELDSDDPLFNQLDARLSDKEFVAPRIAAFRALIDIFTCGWFTRSWIIQEVCTAVDWFTVALVRFRPIRWRFLTHMLPHVGRTILQIDPSFTPALMLFNGGVRPLETIRALSELCDPVSREARDLRDSPDNLDMAQRFHELLLRGRGQFKATEPQDLLYALLGLCGNQDVPMALRPDYKKPFAEVFHQYALFLIAHTGSFHIMPCSKRSLVGVPSWVPDWRYCGFYRAHVEWDTSSLMLMEPSHDGLHLAVDGHFLDTIVGLIDTTPIGQDMDKEYFACAEEPVDIFGAGAVSYLIAIIKCMQRLKELCLRHQQIACPDVTQDDFKQAWVQFWTNYYQGELQNLGELIDGTRDLETADDDGLFTGLCKVVIPDLLPRMESISERGGIGILSSGSLVTSVRMDRAMQVADKVYLVKSIDQPCVLHPEGSMYSFLGTCGETSLRPEDFSMEDMDVEKIILV